MENISIRDRDIYVTCQRHISATERRTTKRQVSVSLLITMALSLNVKPLPQSILMSAFMLLSVAGKAASFQHVQLLRMATPVSIRMMLASQSARTLAPTALCMSSSAEKAREASTNRPFSTDSSNKSDVLVLDPLIVCGPSGVGKGTIIGKFMDDFGGKQHFRFTVSHTSRDPRDGEENGTHYHFTELDSMKELVTQGHFLEHASVHGNMYGTSWSSMRKVHDEGFISLLDIDAQGVQRIKTLQDAAETEAGQEHQYLLQPKYIFIAPPSIETLRERLVGRASESEESLQRRVGNAEAEVAYGLAAGNFDAIVYNDDLEQACRDFDETVRSLYNL